MMPPDQFAQLVAAATDEQLAEGVAVNREPLLEEIFTRWPEQFRPERAGDVNAVVEWQVTHDDGGHDSWQIAIADGACSVTREGDADPDVTFRCGPVDLIRLIAGAEAGPKLFVFGRLKIRGNLMLAARFQGFFAQPGARGGDAA
jgi:putative sterol carrier protein